MKDDFLKEEVRSGFTVTTDMKKIWACQLNMIDALLKVCDKYNLKIWADGGTLIGAVRHHGYIPWDDDIDMAMMRDDYDKLLAVADAEFKDPFLFQTIYSDPYYNHRHAQIRDSRTTAMPYDSKLKYNQGIFIDIFPLDTYPKTLKTARSKIGQVRKARVILKWAQGICRRMPRQFYLKHRWDIAAFRNFEDVLRAPDPANSPYLATLSTHMKEVIKTKPCYDSTLFVPFEYITMPIPCGYDTLLTTQYGDYMTPVHEDTFHGALLYDPDHSYKEYMKMPVSKRKRIG